jgi:hypothetical protein
VRVPPCPHVNDEIVCREKHASLLWAETSRPCTDLVTFLGQELSANSKIDKDNKAYVTGAMDLPKLQVRSPGAP